MRIKEGFMMREVAGKYVVVPVGAGTDIFKGMIQMNGLGAFLWGKLQKEQTKESLIESVLENYEVSSDRAAEDIDKFILQLSDAGILEK